MSKIFLSYDQQIEKLKNEKKRQIDDEVYAEDVQLISKDGKIYFLPTDKAELRKDKIVKAEHGSAKYMEVKA